MRVEEIDDLLRRQKAYFQTGETLDVNYRIAMLKRLQETIIRRQDEITEALKADLGKSAFEGFMCEVGMTLSELSHMIRCVKRFARKKRVPTPMAQFAARSYTQAVPYGNILIMSPWNYPFLLTMGPLVDALAAGNTAIVKPSAYSPATSRMVEKIITEAFPKEYVAVVTGGRAENQHLLEMKFDFVFFTGSQGVGKEVLRHTAEHLTPAVLELGGKSPCIVDNTAKISLAAKRIVFGKFLNCGQTCVAPDYILCQKDVKDKLVEEIKKQVILQYGEAPLDNPNYGKIINEKHFERLIGLIDEGKVVIGGKRDEATQQIAPTVMDNVTWGDAVMQEEIFGPILPILTFDKISDIYDLLKVKAKPLAFYYFTENKENAEKVTMQCSFGGGCINDTIIHLATTDMGFGGVGESGMGAYHGETGFKTFSHTKSIVDKKTFMDLPMRYQPYQKKYEKFIRMFLK